MAACDAGWPTGNAGLAEHVAALHEAHPPWGLTPFGVQSALLKIPEAARTPVRLAAAERIGSSTADEIRDDLREFAHLGGFTLRPGSTPWFGAALRTTEDVSQACDLAARLGTHALPMLADRLSRASEETGLRPPGGYADAVARMRLYAAIGQTLRTLDRSVYAARPQALAAAVGGGDMTLGFSERRALRRQARDLYTGPGKPAPQELA
jgi:hypothetical protein